MQAGPPLKLVQAPTAAPEMRDLGNLGASIVRLARLAADSHANQLVDQASRLRELVRSLEEGAQ